MRPAESLSRCEPFVVILEIKTLKIVIKPGGRRFTLPDLVAQHPQEFALNIGKAGPQAALLSLIQATAWVRQMAGERNIRPMLKKVQIWILLYHLSPPSTTKDVPIPVDDLVNQRGYRVLVFPLPQPLTEGLVRVIIQGWIHALPCYLPEQVTNETLVTQHLSSET